MRSEEPGMAASYSLRDFMAAGLRPVFVCAIGGRLSELHTVTITSLISTNVQPGTEQVAFVLKDKSSFLALLKARAAIFSISMLGDMSTEEASHSAQIDRPIRRQKDTRWQFAEGVPLFLDSLAWLKGRFVTTYPAGPNSVVVADVLSVSRGLVDFGALHWGYRKFWKSSQLNLPYS